MLPLGRRIPHKHLVAGLAATLQVAALTADAVALEARKTQKADDADTARHGTARAGTTAAARVNG